MNYISSTTSEKLVKSQEFKGDSKESAQELGKQSRTELFEEFSRILDKIAVHLSQNSDIPTIEDIKQSLVVRETQERCERSYQEVEVQEELQNEVSTDNEYKAAVKAEEDVENTEEGNDEESGTEQEEIVVSEDQAAEEETAFVEDQGLEQVQVSSEVVVQTEVEKAIQNSEAVEAAPVVEKKEINLKKDTKSEVTPEQWQDQHGHQKEAKGKEKVDVQTKENLLESDTPKQELKLEQSIPEDVIENVKAKVQQLTAKKDKSENTLVDKVVKSFLVEDAAKLGAQQDLSTSSSGHEAMIASMLMRQVVSSMNVGQVDRSVPSNGLTTTKVVESAPAKDFQNASDAKFSSKAKTLSQSKASRTLERVEKALKEAAKARDGKTISLRLDPPNLGSVRVDVSIRDSVLHARLFADLPEVNTLLRDKAHELQRMLRKLGINVDEVSVSVNADGERFSEQGGLQKESYEQTTDNKEEMILGKQLDAKERVNTISSEQSVDDHWVA